MARRNLFGMRKRPALEQSRGDRAALEAFYMHRSGTSLSPEQSRMVPTINAALNHLLRELIGRADVRRLAQADALRGHGKTTDLIDDLRGGRVAVMAGVTGDPTVNALIRPVTGGYLIEMTWTLYWLVMQFCSAIAASTPYEAADGSVGAEAVAISVARTHFQQCLDNAAAGRNTVDPPPPWELQGLAEQEWELYVELVLQFALAHELGHLLEGHLSDDYQAIPNALVRLPGHLYSKSEELTADQVGALLMSGLFSRDVSTQFYGPIILFELLDAVDMYGVGSKSIKHQAKAVAARAATSHPHPSYRTNSAIRAALFDSEALELGMCDLILGRAELVAGGPEYVRDAQAGQRLYDNFDSDISRRLLDLFNPSWDGSSTRIVDEDAVAALVNDDERVAIACLNTVGALYLDQVRGGLRVVSARIQLALAHIYTLFYQRHLKRGTSSFAAKAAADDLEAAIPEWPEMVLLWHQLGVPTR